jgi:hypothetical protein
MGARRSTGAAAAGAMVVLASLACNDQRKQECERFLAATKPLDRGTPDATLVDSVAAQVEGLKLQDTTLAIYAKNYRATLTVLSNTLELMAGPNAPDGTDEVVAQNLKAARTDAADVARYCTP